MNPTLKSKIDALPDKPGCYLFRDARGRIIYVGKAVSLRKRVQSYFRPAALRRAAPKLRSLVHSIADLDVVRVRNTEEALLTEGRLIKDYRPRYNVVFRDDKRYLAIRADSREPLPRLTTCRILRDDGADYFGPFPSSDVVRTAVDFTERHYGLRRCAPLIPDRDTYRHCLNDIIRFCAAPCIGKITPDAYKARFAEACAFLRGQRPQVLRDLGEAMREAARRRDFERAATLRDTLFAVRALVHRRLRTADVSEPTQVRIQRGLAILRETLALPRLPRIIEGFDISNTGGELAVASLVCAVDGIPQRARYRRYRIRWAGGIDDPRMIAEAVERRYQRLQAEGRPMPDLVLVDGGRTQRHAARKALDALGLETLPVVGLAKTFEEMVGDDNKPPIRFPADSPALHVLQRLRDEAHRFALDYHHRLRARKLRESALDDIPGIGPARKALLLTHFGSAYKLSRASVDAVAALPGISRTLAEAIVRAAGGAHRNPPP